MEDIEKQCKECCRNISEEDSKKYNGYCKNCFNSKDEEADEECIRNNVANLIQTLSKIIVILSIIISILVGTENGTLAVIIFLSTSFASLILYGFGEIIQLLEDIYWKINKRGNK